MPRGRRVNSSGEKSKQLLREKAIELFSKKGFHNTKISDIVQAANVTQPTFYLYFESKEALFYALNEEFKENLINIIEKYLHKNFDNTKEHIEFLIVEMFHYFLENASLTQMVINNVSQSMLIKEKLAESFLKILKPQKSSLPNLNDTDAYIIAESLVGSIEQLTQKVLLTNLKSKEQLANYIVSIYFDTKHTYVTY